MRPKFIDNDSPRLFPSEISERFEEPTCPEANGSSLAVSPARIFPPLVKALGWLVADQGCGTSTIGSSKKSSRDSRLWKTLAGSHLKDSTKCFDALPRSGTMRNGRIYAPPMSERPTEGNESGLWLIPTPCANPEAPNHGSNSNGPHNLKEVAQSGWKPGQMWPTPTGHDGRDNASGGAMRRKSPGLGALAQAYATPQARDFRTGQQSQWEDPNRTRNLNDQIGGQLNPTWVEWLMGYPLFWTEV